MCIRDRFFIALGLVRYGWIVLALVWLEVSGQAAALVFSTVWVACTADFSRDSAEEYGLSPPVAVLSALLVAASGYGLYRLSFIVWPCIVIWWQWLIGHFGA